MAHVSKRKKLIIETLTKFIDEYPIIGAINMQNIPAKQLQVIRNQIRGKAVIYMAKRRLMKIAFKNSNYDGNFSS